MRKKARTSFCAGTLFAAMVLLAAPGTAGAQSPSLDGLVGWYQASSLSLSNGQSVSSWNDLSGNGNTLTLTGSGITYQTNALNGQPAVAFAGGGYLNNPAMTGLGGTSFEMFAVLTNVTSGAVADLGSSTSIFNNEAILGYGDGLSVYHESSAGHLSHLEYQTSPGGAPYILEGVYGNSPTDLMSYVNGVGSTDTVASFASPQNYTSDTRQLTVGSRDNYLMGDLTELLVYDNTLTPAEEQQTGSYLQSEYGIAGSYATPEPAAAANLVFAGGLLLLRRRKP